MIDFEKEMVGRTVSMKNNILTFRRLYPCKVRRILLFLAILDNKFRTFEPIWYKAKLIFPFLQRNFGTFALLAKVTKNMPAFMVSASLLDKETEFWLISLSSFV